MREASLTTLALLLSLGACDTDTTTSEDELAGTSWVLSAIEKPGGITVEISAPPRLSGGNPFYSLTFADTLGVKGGPGVRQGNRAVDVVGYPNAGLFFYDSDPERARVAIYPHAVTEIAPPPDSKEDLFFDGLVEANAYDLDGNRLRIAYGEDGAALRFEVRDFAEDASE